MDPVIITKPAAEVGVENSDESGAGTSINLEEDWTSITDLA